MTRRWWVLAEASRARSRWLIVTAVRILSVALLGVALSIDVWAWKRVQPSDRNRPINDFAYGFSSMRKETRWIGNWAATPVHDQGPDYSITYSQVTESGATTTQVLGLLVLVSSGLAVAATLLAIRRSRWRWLRSCPALAVAAALVSTAAAVAFVHLGLPSKWMGYPTSDNIPWTETTTYGPSLWPLVVASCLIILAFAFDRRASRESDVRSSEPISVVF